MPQHASSGQPPARGEALVLDDRAILMPLATDVHTARPSIRALKDKRIVAFDPQDRLTRNFDLLRNRILTDFAATSTPVIAVSAPTAGCGASMTAANLALSFARQRSGTVLLADMNRVSAFDDQFSLNAEGGHNRERASGLCRVDAGGVPILTAQVMQMLPSPDSASAFAPLAAAWVTRARQELNPAAIVLDLPPLLQSDDVAAIGASADAMVIVLAVGTSTIADYEASRSSLPGTRCYVILNKTRRHAL